MPVLHFEVNIYQLENSMELLVRTNITAKPIPSEALTVFKTAKYEHIPKKRETMFSMKMLL